ncbi:uncharacterized protein LOC111058148 [Nilaparvata lugens]|uniref:uncharacterized protein LOC111058148 n=1 Tax=Nilaparvata lugens TaxID=108931 RepID=UPI000B986B96|nr:uncharacterized protein LOC111058148 [Nilaparvata lugens]
MHSPMMLSYGETQNTEQEAQQQLDLWYQEFKEFGMKISKSKTVVLKVSRDNRPCTITLEGQRVESVEDFSYLGSMLDREGRNDKEVINRVRKGAQFYQQVRTLLWNKDIPLKTKQTLYSSYYVPIASYSLEACTTNRREESRLQAGEMKFLRTCVQKTRRDRVRNDEIRKEVEQRETLLTHISNARLRWYGHVERMENTRTAKVWLHGEVEGRRPRGRPRRRWRDQVRREIQERGLDWRRLEEERSYLDRQTWRGIVNRTRATGDGDR